MHNFSSWCQSASPVVFIESVHEMIYVFGKILNSLCKI